MRCVIPPDSAPKHFYWNRLVPQRAKSSDKDVVNELIARQDDVIGELNKLEAEILEAIELLNASRHENKEAGESTVAPDPDVSASETLKMPQQQDLPVSDDIDRSSRAA